MTVVSDELKPKRRGPLWWVARLAIAWLCVEGAWAGLSIWQRARHPLQPSGDANREVVLFLGDSTLFGTGYTDRGEAPPSRAARTLELRPVDHSVPGLTPTEALRRLPQTLAIHRPARMVLSLGADAWATDRLGPPEPMPEWLRGFEFSDSLVGSLFEGGDEPASGPAQSFLGRWHKGNADIRFLEKNNLCVIGTIVGNWSQTAVPGEIEVTVAGAPEPYRLRYRFEGKQLVLEGATLPEGRLILDPGPPPPGPIAAADSFGLQGDYELARLLITGAMQTGETPALLGELGYFDARLGSAERAGEAIARLDRVDGAEDGIRRAKAMVHLGLGEVDEALKLCEPLQDFAPDARLFRRLVEHGRDHSQAVLAAARAAIAASEDADDRVLATLHWVVASLADAEATQSALVWASRGPAGLPAPAVFEAMALGSLQVADPALSDRLATLRTELDGAAKDLEACLRQFDRIAESYGASLFVYHEPGRAPVLDLALRNLIADDDRWSEDRIIRAFTCADQEQALTDVLRRRD